MLERSGKQGADVSDEKLAELFTAQLAKFDRWVAARSNIALLSIDYKDMIASPKVQCEKIGEFLGGVLDTDAAAAAVDPSLYRNRS
jgi:hypothetical protein